MRKKLADMIREYCIQTRILPARQENKELVSIRAGDIHKEMKLTQRMPSICEALQARTFETLANVKRINLAGPKNGANCIMTFKLCTDIPHLSKKSYFSTMKKFWSSLFSSHHLL